MNIESEVLAVSASFDAVLITNDAEAVGSFMSDDWVYFGPAGATPKSDIVRWIASGQLAHHTMDAVGEVRVAVHGDAATVTARKQSSGSWDGGSYTADEWISDVYVRTDERWLCVLSHKCPVDLDA